jgi:hypothetical protein
MPEIADLLGRMLMRAMELHAVNQSLKDARTLSDVRLIVSDRADPLLAEIVEAACEAAKELKARKPAGST